MELRAKKILTIRLSSMGDVVQTTGALREVRNAFPEAHITHLVRNEYLPLIENHTSISQIVTIESNVRTTMKEMETALLPHGPFDLTIDFQGSTESSRWAYASKADVVVGRSAFGPRMGWKYVEPTRWERHSIHELGSLLTGLNIPFSDLSPFISTTSSAKETIDYWLEKKKLKRKYFVIFNPFTSTLTRSWPIECFLELIQRKKEYGSLPIVITGSKSEAFQKQSVITQLTQQGAISAVGEFNLRESLALFEAAKYMVTGDTGPMHAAAALGTRVIALFGPSWPERNGPWGKGHHVIQKVSPSTHRAFKDPASVSLMQLIKPNDVIPVLKEGAL